MAGGAYSLDFADTDVREAVAQVLGGMLNLTYTIDPAVHGTVTLHTARPLSRAQLFPPCRRCWPTWATRLWCRATG